MKTRQLGEALWLTALTLIFVSFIFSVAVYLSCVNLCEWCHTVLLLYVYISVWEP